MRGRAVLIIATVVVVIVSAVVPAGAQPPQGDDASYVVVLAPGADVPATAAQLANEHGGHVGQLYEAVLGGFQFTGSSSAAAGLARSPRVQTVVPDEQFALVDSAGWGFFRIDAEVSVNDPSGPYRGANTRVAVIDSGIDTDHPDLAPHLDLTNSYNCQNPGALPEDDNGHGTHVSGVAAAAFNGNGLVGVAPDASIVSLKAFDANGYADTSDIICALNRLAVVTTSSPVPTALNMSFADVGGDSVCDDLGTDVLHEAICDVVDAGATATPSVPVIPVAAAGNDDAEAANTVPAAFHDVITVSALADFDGKAGGLDGCVYVANLFNYECDDTIASFSNWGSVVDVMAPGVEIYSTVPGGYGTNTGTSMAAPHVTGVVALVLSEYATADFATVRSLLLATGECPDGSVAGDAACDGQGAWKKTKNRTIFDGAGTLEADPDGIAEPLVNAGRAAARADLLGDPVGPPPPPPTDAPPTVDITSPSTGATVSGTVTISAIAGDDNGVTGVEVFVDDVSIGGAVLAGGTWSTTWDSTGAGNGLHTITAVATDSIGQTTTSAPVEVTVSNSTASASMHVSGLSGGTSTQGKKWTATAVIDVSDGDGVPLDGVTVVVSFESPTTASLAGRGGTPGGPGGGGGGGGGSGGTETGVLSCVTSQGTCSVSTKPAGSSVRFIVDDLQKDGWTYVPGDNTADPHPDTAATDIVVNQPA